MITLKNIFHKSEQRAKEDIMSWSVASSLELFLSDPLQRSPIITSPAGKQIVTQNWLLKYKYR